MTNDSDDVSAVVNCINVLLSKDDFRLPAKASNPFDSLLLHKLTLLQETISSDGNLQRILEKHAPSLLHLEEGADIQWRFLGRCIFLLVTLKNVLEEAAASEQHLGVGSTTVPTTKEALPLTPLCLSFSQQKKVQGLLQFIIALGIYPNLLPGVGVPLSRRTECGMPQCTGSPVPWKKHRALVTSVRTLLACIESATLRDLVFDRHLVDILASLLQLCHAPILKVPNCNCESGDNINASIKHSTVSQLQSSLLKYTGAGPVDVEALVKEMLCDRNHFLIDLQHLLESTYEPLLVRELLLMLSLSSFNKSLKGDGGRRLPKWLKNVCGQLLTQCLLRSGGLARVLRGVFDACSVDVSGTVSEKDWEKCDVLATTIARIPSSETITSQSYYEKIGAQVVDLLKLSTSSNMELMMFRVACRIAGSMLDAQPQLASQLIFGKLFEPLLRCMLLEGDLPPQQEVVASEQEVGCCIELIHKVVCNVTPGCTLLDALVPVFPVLFEIAVFAKDTISYLRPMSENILSATCKSLEPSQAVELLHWCLFGTPGKLPFGRVRQDIRMALGSCAGVKVVSQSSRWSDEEWVARTDQMSLVLAAIFQQGKSREYATAFFMSLLKKLTTAVSCLFCAESAQTSISPTLESEHSSLKLKDHLFLLHLVGSFIELISEDLLENAQSLLEFVAETLNRVLQIPETGGRDSTLISETTLFCLSMLGLLLSSEDVNRPEQRELFQRCLPCLDAVGANHKSREVRDLARQLQLAIASQGTVGLPSKHNLHSKSSPSAGSSSDGEDNSTWLKKMMGIMLGYNLHFSFVKPSEYKPSGSIPSPSNKWKVAGDSEAGRSLADGVHHSKHPSSTAFEEAWSDLQDAMVPVWGHAFIQLRRLLEEGDAETWAHADQLLEACQTGIQEEDSYIYLSAIQALAVIVEKDLDRHLPWLADQVASEQLTIEARLNLGEVFLRVSKSLGEMAPKFRNLLVNCFLGAAKHPDPVVRSSAVSNLGEICGRLGYSFAPIVQEILACLRGLVKDSDNNVSRAAVLALSSIIKGMGPKLFQVMPLEIRDIYRDLRHLYEFTTDDITKLQAQQAVEELNFVTQEFLKTKPRLEKRIQILDLNAS